MRIKLKDFSFKVGDTVYVRTNGGIATDKIVNISSAGIVKLERTPKEFYLNGRPIGPGRSVYRIVDIYKAKSSPTVLGTDWISALVEGDEVILSLSNGRKLLTSVVKITGAGKIKVKNNLEMFYPDGSCVHRGRLTAQLEPATDETKAILKQQGAREKALQTIVNCNFSILPADKLIAIQKIIQE